MASTSTKELSSLLPYLQPEGNATAVLSLTPQGAAAQEGAYPFSILNDADPFTRLFEGEIVSGAGSSLIKVFLLVQRDHYLVAEDALSPLTNVDVEKAWQQAHARYRGKSELPVPIFLSSQERGGTSNPLAPLLYCTRKKRFFHPPCPTCGDPLRLCKDDDFLRSRQLRPYSSSLKRYLFCAPCAERGSATFYVYELGAGDPPGVLDRWSLMGQLGALRRSNGATAAIPCLDCAEGAECFASGGSSRPHLVPFSFYPFSLLIFESCTMNALDFLPLLSGAPFSVVEGILDAGRQARMKSLKGGEQLAGSFLFPANDHRHFLEVLYLKLTFLMDVLKRMGAESSVTVNQIWVEVAPSGNQMPSLWSFRTAIIDVSGPLRDRASVHRPPGRQFQAGMLWFYVLLVNGTQDGAAVLPAVQEKAAAGALAGELKPPFAPLFRPEQLFFRPEAGRVSREWQPLWAEALDLGRQLLTDSAGQDFPDRLDALRAALKEYMLGGPVQTAAASAEPAPADDDAGENRALLVILQRITERWRKEVSLESATPRAPKGLDEMETVILPSEAAQQPSPIPPEAAAKPSAIPSEGDEVTRTVVLTPGGGAASAPEPGAEPAAEAGTGGRAAADTAPPQARPAPPPCEGEPLAETLPLGSRLGATKHELGSTRLGSGPAAPAPAPGESLDETVAIAPGAKATGAGVGPAAAPAGGEEAALAATLPGQGAGEGGPAGKKEPPAATAPPVPPGEGEETVLLHPQATAAPGEEAVTETVHLQPGEKPKQRKPASGADEDLAQTVILPPRKRN